MATVSSIRPVLMIVDDDAEVLRSLAFMAETRGYQVTGCASAAEAMSRLDGILSCLILDQNLPDMEGMRLLQRIRAAGVRAPALMITTNPSTRLLGEAKAAGVPIVEKPLLDESLFEQVERLLAAG